MEAIFTLPYSEYEVINQLQKKLGKLIKSKGISFYIPTSRQQKGIDFIIHNNETKKVLRMQVKSSRAYVDEPNGKNYQYNFWFNNFIDKYKPDVADYYILFGLYPVYVSDKNIKSKTDFWKSITLCFSDKDMNELLKSVKTKNSKKTDRFFAIGFNQHNTVFGKRGFENNPNFSENLLENKLTEIKEHLM